MEEVVNNLDTNEETTENTIQQENSNESLQGAETCSDEATENFDTQEQSLLEEVVLGNGEQNEEDKKQEKSKKKKILDVLWYVFFTLVLLITIFTCCSVALFDCYVVEGRSMENTVYDGDKVSVCVLDKDYGVGDVVVLRQSTNQNTLLIKRIIAIGPALVKIDKEGNVYVNDLNDENNVDGVTINDGGPLHGYDKLIEPYVASENKKREGAGLVKEELKSETSNGYYVEDGYVFYLGDNRAHSTDSRSEGAVPKNLIVGKVSDYFLKRKDTLFYKILTTNIFEKIKEGCKRR